MPASPFTPDDVAWCRQVVTNPQNLVGMDPAAREDILRGALDVLRKDRASRLARTETRCRILVMPSGPGMPGDAT